MLEHFSLKDLVVASLFAVFHALEDLHIDSLVEIMNFLLYDSNILFSVHMFIDDYC